MGQISVLDFGFILVFLWLLYVVIHSARKSLRRMRTTQLNGPPNESFLFGMTKVIRRADDYGAIFEKWAGEYGAVYRIQSMFNSSRVVLCDPKAIAHFYSKETFVYVNSKSSKLFIANLVRCLSSSYQMSSLAHCYTRSVWTWIAMVGRGESQKVAIRDTVIGDCKRLICLCRQRKALSPAFSNGAIRRLTSVFFDSSYKVSYQSALQEPHSYRHCLDEGGMGRHVRD